MAFLAPILGAGAAGGGALGGAAGMAAGSAAAAPIAAGIGSQAAAIAPVAGLGSKIMGGLQSATPYIQAAGMLGGQQQQHAPQIAGGAHQFSNTPQMAGVQLLPTEAPVSGGGPNLVDLLATLSQFRGRQ